MAEAIASDLSELSLLHNKPTFLDVRGSLLPCNAAVICKIPALAASSRGSQHVRLSLDLDPSAIMRVVEYVGTGHMHLLLPGNVTEDPLEAMQQLGVELQLPELHDIESTLRHSVKREADLATSQQVQAWDAAAALVLGICSRRLSPSSDSSSDSTSADALYDSLLAVVSHPIVFNTRIIQWAVATAKQHAPFLSKEQIDTIDSSYAKAAEAVAPASALAGPSSSQFFELESESEMYSAESCDDYFDAE